MLLYVAFVHLHMHNIGPNPQYWFQCISFKHKVNIPNNLWGQILPDRIVLIHHMFKNTISFMNDASLMDSPSRLHTLRDYNMSLYCKPDCQFQSMPGSQGHLKTCSIYCFRVTACSLHIQKTIIFMLFFFYLEVNGCQETNEAARNSCTSTRRLPCDAEGGIK